MNNLTLGSDDVVYYETIGGGQGACADADGPSGVHVAMSNTLNTPIEALELEFPLRMVRYARRLGSGGRGAHRGGDGVIRELEALAPLRYSLITERRRHRPAGAAGGEPGLAGRNLLDGALLDAKAVGDLAPGQRLRIETPGGGGYGEATARDPVSRTTGRSDGGARAPTGVMLGLTVGKCSTLAQTTSGRAAARVRASARNRPTGRAPGSVGELASW